MRKLVLGRWGGIACVVFALLWLQAEVRAWLLCDEIDRVYTKSVTIQAVDAKTLQPVQITIHNPPRSSDQRWPKRLSTESVRNVSEMKLHWIGIESLEVGVSSDGYQRQQVRLGSDSEPRIEVRLER